MASPPIATTPPQPGIPLLTTADLEADGIHIQCAVYYLILSLRLGEGMLAYVFSITYYAKLTCGRIIYERTLDTDTGEESFQPVSENFATGSVPQFSS
jgi:hypothetical protein